MNLLPDEWDDILEDIAEQKTVLLIGPDMIQHDGKSVNHYLRETVVERYADDIAYYYERDGLFLFTSPEGKVRVARQVKRFYRSLQPEEAMLRCVAEIPFHLIVSVNPDTFLTESFYRYGLKHRFHYFQHRDRANDNEKIERPHRAMPLIYNLFGSKDQDDSLILDYDDVYRMLQSMFGSSSLPGKFLSSFRDARTYIFLGFQFDKWYSQLLLKFLTEDATRDKFIAVRSVLNDADIEGFVMREFKVQFIADSFDFFNALYEHCRAADLLRPLIHEAASPKGVEIRQRISNGELHEALDSLQKVLDDTEWRDEATLQLSRYNKLEDEHRKGTLDPRDYHAELNRIIDAVLELTKKLPA